MTKAELKLARDRFKLAAAADDKQRQREKEDLRFYAGEQWDADRLKAREGGTFGSGSAVQVVPARPSLVINKTREPVRQVQNQERQSDLGIELIPADDFGESQGPIDHSEIELREGLVRRIQRDSEAADARSWAFARATIAGRGYWLIMTRFVPGKRFEQDQEVYIERIFNQAAVLLDPAHEQPDGSDAKWGFYGRDMSWQDYKAEFKSTREKPNKVSQADTDDDWRALMDDAPDWFTSEGDTRMVRVMNYYYEELDTKTLFALSNGFGAYEDELKSLPPGVTQVFDKDGQPETREETTKQIYWAKIDGAQVLDETEWPGHYIPIIKVVGEELQPYDNERRCEGIVRPMRDACEGNNYTISKFVERFGLTPISPWMLASGQDEGYEDEYNAANTRALSRLHYNQVDDMKRPAPPPFRVDARTEIADVAMGLQLFAQAIESTSVVPVPALGKSDSRVTSAKMARQLTEQAQQGTSNFLDNLVRSMRHEARVTNDLLYPIYGSRPGRLARLMNPQGEKDAVIIGQPFTMQGQGAQARPQPVNVQPGQPLPEGAKHYQLTPNAEFNVAVKISKNFDTRRQEEAQTVGEMIAAEPQLMTWFGDLFFKNQDGPGHEEMAERAKLMLDPRIQQSLTGQQPIPPEVQVQMAAMQQQLQEAMALADKNKADLTKTQMQEQAETERNRADNETRLAVAELGAKVERLTLFLEERERLGVQQHEVGLSMLEHQQALEQQAHAHAQTLQQGEQGAVIASQQAEQQAELNPPKTNGSGA